MISHNDSEDANRDCVNVKVHGASGTIVLDRPTKRNAIHRRMLSALIQAFDDLHQEKKVRAIILTGAGDAFCAGTDLAEMAQTMKHNAQAQQTWFEDCMAQKQLIEVMLRFPKPIIAAVNGAALGLGATLALASDIVIGTNQSSFGFPEVHRGLVPGLAVPLLNFRLGAAVAADFLLRGEVADGELAHKLGVYRLNVAHELLWAKADEMAREISLSASAAVLMTKRLMNESMAEAMFTQLSNAAAATATARTTEFAQEGVMAFLEKREPDWP